MFDFRDNARIIPCMNAPLTDIEMARGWLRIVRDLKDSGGAQQLEASQELARRYVRSTFNRLYRETQSLIAQITTASNTYPTSRISRQLGVACDYLVSDPELALNLIEEAHASACWHLETARSLAESRNVKRPLHYPGIRYR